MGELERQNERLKAKGFFYEQDRLQYEERNLVRIIVGSLVGYLTRDQKKFLIAGIGGMLRDAASADIDIGVIGFKYAGNYEKFANEFLQEVTNYYAHLRNALAASQSCGEGTSRKTIGLLEEGECKTYGLHKPSVIVQMELSADSAKTAKSIEFKAQDCRPIHIHFFYDNDAKKWMKSKQKPERACAPLVWKGLPARITKELDAINSRYK